MIFSDNFTVIKRYSLYQKKYLCTFSTMPWICTSLYENIYKPDLSQEIKDKLNALFRYKHFLPTYTIKDEEKFLGIFHEEDKILGFHAFFSIHYHSVKEMFNWQHFISSAKIEKLASTKDTLELLTSETDIFYTVLLGIDYNEKGEETVLYTGDKSYFLDEYNKNPTINKLNEYCKKNINYVVGIIGIHPNSSKITYKLQLQYPFAVDTKLPEEIKVHKTIQTRITEYEVAERHLYGLRKMDFLSEEDVNYITNDILKDVVNKNYKFTLEYLFDEEGNVEDIIFNRYIMENFKEIEKDIVFDPLILNP